MQWIKHIASTRLARGTAMGVYGQLAQLIVQFISVPVFTTHWGLAAYGVWLIMFTVPGMLSLADLGLTVAGGNAMTAAIAQGDMPRAARLYGSLRWTVAITGCAALAVSGVFLLWIRPGTLGFAQASSGGHAFAVIMILLTYGGLALFNGIALAGFRAADAFAWGGTVYHTIALAEAILVLIMVTLGSSMVCVALAYLVARIGLTAAMALELRRLAGWTAQSRWRPHLVELREIAAPAAAALVMTGANAVAIQGAVMAIGATAGPAAVPLFTTVRTMSRTALQFTFRFNIASMPRYTIAAAQGDEKRKTLLFLANMIVAIAILVPAAIAFLLWGLPFIKLWTAGVVNPPFALLVWMVTAMLLNGLWMPLSNLIMAINRHASFTYFYLAIAGLSIGLGAFLAPRWSVSGMAAALAAMELIMLLRIVRLTMALAIFDSHQLGPAWHEVRQWLGKSSS